MPRPASPALELTPVEREELAALARSVNRSHRVVVQACGLLLAADGVANAEITRRCEVDADAVRRWRARFRVEEKLVGVVGMYLNPPARAVVFSYDEKTQC